MKILSGQLVKIYLNNKVYGPAQQVQYTIDMGEKEFYGIDSLFPQEITATRFAVRGQINGLKLINSGGLQAIGLRPLVKSILSAPYISIRIQDRLTGEDIIFIPRAKITSESFSAQVKGLASLSFGFSGISALQPLDRV